MKKLLALLLSVVMAMSVTVVSASAESVDINGKITDAIMAAYESYGVNKEDIDFSYIKPLTQGKYLVKFSVADFSYPCDIVHMDIGKYLLVSTRPLPEVYDGGVMYSLEKANKYRVLKDADLELMDTFEELNFSKTKTSQSLVQAMGICDDDDYINVKFELEGSFRDIDSFDNWHNDISGAYDKLVAFKESLHDKLINETLKDFDYIDVRHSNGLSVVAVKKGDIAKIAKDDFVQYMDYISDVHAEFIKTYSPSLTGYSYKEIAYGYDDDYNDTYVLVKVNAGVSAQSISFRLGDVIIRSGTVHPYFKYGYAVYDTKEDKFYDIFDVRDTLDKYKNLEKYLAVYCEEDVDIVGDCDTDGKLTILDATKIQRVVAKLDELSTRDEYYPLVDQKCGYMSDVDNDGIISVMDATAIRLKLAQLE